MIELALTIREELTAMKQRTRQAGEEAANTIGSETVTYNGHRVYCRSQLKKMKGQQIMRINVWYFNDRRIGENHLFGTIEKL
jgi:hypothetical protein